MKNLLTDRRLAIITIIVIALSLLLLIIPTRPRHRDIVIKTATEEFIVDDYNLDHNKECVYFTYDGHVRTICGSYEIIE
jgi:hypothetical protein